MDRQLGDIFQLKNARFCYLEVVASPSGSLGYFSLIERRQGYPTPFIEPNDSHNLLFLGNGLTDPALREHCTRLMEIAGWMHRGEPNRMPRTAAYITAYREWEAYTREFARVNNWYRFKPIRYL